MPAGEPRGTFTRRLWIAAAVALLILLIWFAVRAWQQSRAAPAGATEPPSVPQAVVASGTA